MLSRVANSIFWMSRYLERAENVARFIDVNLNMTLGLDGGPMHQWEPLVYTTGDYALFKERHGEASQQNVIRFLAFDPEYPNSIVSCLRAARENARTVREIIASEMWEEVNKFYLMVRGAGPGWWSLRTMQEFFHQVKLSGHLLAGITDATMSHGEAWHFGRMGRLLERADKTTRILDVKYYILLPSPDAIGTPFDSLQWAALLKSASALEMYRKVHGRITAQAVADFLILDRDFPRAVHFCLIRAEESLHLITGTRHGAFANSAEKHLGRLRAELDFTQMQDILDAGLHEYLDQLQHRLNEIGDAVFDTFFEVRREPATASQTAAPAAKPAAMQVQTSA